MTTHQDLNLTNERLNAGITDTVVLPFQQLNAQIIAGFSDSSHLGQLNHVANSLVAGCRSFTVQDAFAHAQCFPEVCGQELAAFFEQWTTEMVARGRLRKLGASCYDVEVFENPFV